MNRSQQKIIFGISVLVFSIFATDAFAGGKKNQNKKNKSGQNKQATSYNTIVEKVQNDGLNLGKVSPKLLKEPQIIEHRSAKNSQEEEKFNSSLNPPKSQHSAKPSLSDQDHLSNNDSSKGSIKNAFAAQAKPHSHTSTKQKSNELKLNLSGLIDKRSDTSLNILAKQQDKTNENRSEVSKHIKSPVSKNNSEDKIQTLIQIDNEFTLTEKTNNNIFINNPASNQIKLSFHSAQSIEQDNKNKVRMDEEENMNNIVPLFVNTSFDESKPQIAEVHFLQKKRSNSLSTPSNKSNDNNHDNTNKRNQRPLLSSKSSVIEEYQEQQTRQIIEYKPSNTAQIDTQKIIDTQIAALEKNQHNASFEQILTNQGNTHNSNQKNELLFTDSMSERSQQDKSDKNISLDKISNIDSSSSHNNLSQEEKKILTQLDDEFQNQSEKSHSNSNQIIHQSSESSSNQSITHQSPLQNQQQTESDYNKQDALQESDELISDQQFKESKINTSLPKSESQTASEADESLYSTDQSESDQNDSIQQISMYQKSPTHSEKIKQAALSSYQYKINNDYRNKNITAVVDKLAPQLEKTCQEFPGLEKELKESIEEIRKNHSAHSTHTIEAELMKVVNNRYKQIISDKTTTANTQLSNNAKFNSSRIAHVVSSRIEHNVNLGAIKAAGSDVERQQHSAWSNVFGGFSKDSSAGISSKSNYFGFSLGYELKLEQDLTLGSSFTYAKNTNKYDREKFNSNNYLFSLYGINQLNRWILSAAVFGGFGNANVTREIPGGVNAKGKFNTSSYGAYARVGYLFRKAQDILMPSIGISYIYTSQGRYSEHGGSNNMEVSKGRHIISCGDIALKYTKVIDQIHYQFLPSLKVAVTRDMYFQGSNPIRENNLVNMLDIKKTANKKHTAFVLAPELVFKNATYEVTMLYSLEKSKRFINQLGSLKLKVSF